MNSRTNSDGKQAPESLAKVEDVNRNSPHFSRATIDSDNVKTPDEIGQNKRDAEEVEYKGNADTKNANGTPMKKENK